MTTTPKQYQNDEIDLRELFATLWRNKLLILVITTLFGITGIAYALLTPQEWRSKAVVTVPAPTQVKQLQLRLQELTSIKYDSSQSFAKLLDDFNEKSLFDDFIGSFNSFDNKCEFLKTHGYIQGNAKKDASSLQGCLENSATNITATQKKGEAFYTLSFVTGSALESKKRLTAYIDFLQAKEVTKKNELLNLEIAGQTKTAIFNQQILKADTFKRLNAEITRTELSLRISKSAGIETPVENLNNQSIFPIDLGAKALSEKLKILKEIKDPEIINPELADIRLRLDALQTIPLEIATFTSYHVLQSPTVPLNREKPKRLLVVILAAGAGLMVGIMVALFRNYFLSPAQGISQEYN